jgi:ribonuclease HI
MTATINSDASHYADYKVGAYAFWISTAKGRIRKAGALKGEVYSSNEAEFKSILNGLHTLYNAKLGDITDIYINTDSRMVIRVLKENSNSPWCVDLIKAYNEITGKLNANIILRHVKGHLHTKTPRHWVNDWCDTEAKRHAKAEIKKRFGIQKK